ncbi:serine O-acetyltransferase [Methanococcus vannielii SB]|jgi:serine O-acetyltransferase|uniref:Serine acetyltransferase n=1 Tax=Methanococcus vannielii (strain ATCC 35089 / DSM 1224 / JCM 13029 / OCM 148 / SB) TaxID=406327 RepID=A6UNL6_METVS|nr:serine O-acetyltransferase [Methanococcus vannielii]ABR54088.1 serine O-acetyltransferase [Methanococcus vannielii SB]
MFKLIKEDIKTVLMRDPAAKTKFEVVLCYPGLWSIWIHRLSHWLFNNELITIARVISTISRFLTGIEIHPGAKIGRRCFIDHGMGVVIGETSEIGDDVLIYQGVVLGGTSLERKKRHPTIGNGVVIGSGAKIMGNIEIGNCAKIGAGSVVLKSVTAHATCVGVPGKVVHENRKCAIDLDHGNLPDPISELLENMKKQQDSMENQLKILNLKQDVPKTSLLFNDGLGI